MTTHVILAVAAATTAVAAGAVVVARRRRGAIALSDPTEAIKRPRPLGRAPVAAVVAAVHGGQARTPTADELEAVVYAALEGTYQAVRDIRWAEWRKQRSDFDAGRIAIEDLWFDAAGHVAMALAFGGQWDRVGAAVLNADLLAFWFDFIARHYDQGEQIRRVLDLAELQLTRPTPSEAGWMKDYCKPLIYRLTETAALAGELGPTPSQATHPCDGNRATAPRWPLWQQLRLPTLRSLRSSAELHDALAFVMQLAAEKTALPQAGAPSEVTFDVGALFGLLTELFGLAVSGQVLEMVSTARSWCADQSANPEGC